MSSEDPVSSQAGVGTAHLSPDTDEDGKYTIHGVALGADDVTVGSSGIKKKWPGDELKRAADTLEGKPLVRDHENNTDGTVGTVTNAHYREGVGVLYEGKIAGHYEQLAQDIASGILEVSARAYHAPIDELSEDDDTGALVVEDIRFDNLSIVSQGASPSNSVQMGEATAMAQGPTGGTVAVMEAGGPRPDAAELRSEFDAEADADEESESVDDDETESVDDEEVSVSELTNAIDEMASIDDMQVFGLVMWDDDEMGVISDFEEDEDELLLQIDVVERDDSRFTKTGDSVTKPLHRVDTADEEASESTDDGSVEELEAAWHTPDWDGLAPEREWSEPSMEDFDTDDMSAIDDHFFVSKTGEWPPEDFGDLALPCVFPDGELSLDGLDSVHQMAAQTDGVSDDMADSIKSKANELAKEHFDEPVADEEMSESENETDDESIIETLTVATIRDDDPENDTQDRASTADSVAALEIVSSD